VETNSSQQRVAQFLLQKQRADGGWGETYLSCQNKEYDASGTIVWHRSMLCILLRSLLLVTVLCLQNDIQLDFEAAMHRL
jgi:hypothetical protein